MLEGMRNVTSSEGRVHQTSRRCAGLAREIESTSIFPLIATSLNNTPPGTKGTLKYAPPGIGNFLGGTFQQLCNVLSLLYCM